MNRINLLIITFLFLVSCGSIKDAGKILRNEKISTTDEFLVEKRNPLVLPPDFEKLPTPGSMSVKKEKEEDKIKKILKGPKKDNTINKKPSSSEQSILNKIRK